MDETMTYEPEFPAPGRPRGGVGDAPGPRPAAPDGRYVFGSGARPLDGYTIKRAIGRGGFGEVYYALTDAGKEVALKLITRNLEVERRGVIQCMNLKSPHLIAIHDLRTNDEGDTFVIMEYVAGPSLASILERHPKGLPPAEVRHWLKGLVDGVAYLHDHGIVHRDLKPANLFLEEGVIKIGDYGLSKAITSAREPGHSQSVGTCHYMAPEIGTGKYHKPIDVYAIGVILHEMVTGRVPFDGESVHEVLMKHLTARPDLSVVPEPYRSIVARALAKDPNLRPQRVTELLLPGDARPEPTVRFIADDHATAGSSAVPPGLDARSNARSARSRPAQPPAPEPPPLRIEADDAVLYIGPDTQPPGPTQPRRGLVGLLRAGARSQPQPQRQRPPRRITQLAQRLVTPPPPPPAPEPPVLPTGRLRVAELAGSMLLAAPLAALGTVLSVPLFEVFDGRQPQDVGQLGLLFSSLLLGTWGVLGLAQLWEPLGLTRGQKRLTLAALGLGLGVVLLGLASFTQADFPGQDPPDSAPVQVLRFKVGGTSVASTRVSTVALGAFFGLALGLGGFWRLAERTRPARLRFTPLLWIGLVALVLNQALPVPSPGSGIVVLVLGLLTQLASPWSREAAAYARYCATVSRHRRAA